MHARTSAAFLLFAGCASSRPATSLLLGPPVAEGRYCSLSREPRQLPSVTQVIDSAGVQRLLAQRADGTGSLVLRIGYDTLGVADGELPVVATDLDTSTASTLATALTGSVRQRSPFPAPPGPRQASANSWSVLLRIDLGQPATLRIGRTESCAPEVLNQSELAAALAREWGAFRLSNPTARDTMTVVMRMYVDTAGAVEKATVHEPSGNVQIDRFTQAVALQARFVPALSNRRPIPVWVQIPFLLQVRTPPAKPEMFPACIPSVSQPCPVRRSP